MQVKIFIKSKLLKCKNFRYHGCPECFPDDDDIINKDHSTNKTLTAGDLRAKDKERLDYISQFMEVQVIWTCQIEEELKENAEMRKFFKGYRVPGPIRIRDAFFGGR